MNNQKNKIMSITKFEKAKINNCNYLLSLPLDKLIDVIFDTDSDLDNEGKKIINKESYAKRVKALCSKFINNPDPDNPEHGKIKQTYKKSKSYNGKGRWYVVGFGLQNCKNCIRGFLCEGIYKDFDMKNAAPTIIRNMVIKDFPSIDIENELSAFNLYVKKRTKMMKKYDFNKNDIFEPLFSDKYIFTKNKFLKSFDKDMKKIQKLYWDLDQHPDLKETTKSRNKMGSYLCKLYHHEESKLLDETDKIINNKMDVYIYDGGLIEANQDDILLDILNKEFKGRVEWVQKKFKSHIDFDESLLEDSTCYSAVKKEFEKNHFQIQHPPTFGVEYTVNNKKLVNIYKKPDFSTLAEEYTYESVNPLGMITENSILTKWLQDKNKRKYKRLDFIPKEVELTEIYNTFTGWASDNWEDYPSKTELDSDELEAVETFLNHIKLLVNYEEESYKYFINYIAHLFQKPEEKPLVAILIKSVEGVGKDLLTEFIKNILGKQYIKKTPNVNSILGNFQDDLSQKLIVQFDELEGADGFKVKEKLKHLITCVDQTINPKGKTPFEETSYVRVIIYSNNITPISISQTDRRYIVFQSGDTQEKEYYDNLVSILHNKKYLRAIHDYFLYNIDISNFSPIIRPETQAYRDMKKSNLSPVFGFLYDEFKGDDWKDTFEDEYKIHPKTKDILISSTTIYNNFKYYLQSKGQENMNFNFKKLKAVLGEVGIIKKGFKIQGSVNDYYVIKKNSLLSKLKKMGLEEEYEELDI